MLKFTEDKENQEISKFQEKLHDNKRLCFNAEHSQDQGKEDLKIIDFNFTTLQIYGLNNMRV